jgi:hypothetical protein
LELVYQEEPFRARKYPRYLPNSLVRIAVTGPITSHSSNVRSFDYSPFFSYTYRQAAQEIWMHGLAITLLYSGGDRMRQVVMVIMFGLLITAGCAKDGGQALLDTAQLELKQNNLEHAVQLYWQVLEKYPNSKYAKIANKQLVEISKKPEAVNLPVLYGR